MQRVLVWSLVGGVLLALLKVLEYRHFVHAYPTEVYGGLIALVFTVVGLYLGLRWSRAGRVAAADAALPAESEAFSPDLERLKELSITPREHEILGLIAEGLSNREIGERVFVSENTVKSHAYRLFGKLGTANRVQAVRRGRELQLIP